MSVNNPVSKYSNRGGLNRRTEKLSGPLMRIVFATTSFLVNARVLLTMPDSKPRLPMSSSFWGPVLPSLQSKVDGSNSYGPSGCIATIFLPIPSSALRSAGYFVSNLPVVPVRVEVLDDLILELLNRGVELRLVPSLWPLCDAVVGSTLQFSLIRMRNAQPRQPAGCVRDRIYPNKIIV
ncbi:MAG TPA: hypothetical protein VLB68_13240 [Pyrinomonadaceae bacterium]|nr:hypothetical protein [Pyrinomonadaceae bacterium]